MKTKKLFVLLAIVSMTFALFINCGGGGGADDPLPIQNPLPTLKISEATQISTTGAAFSIEVGRVSSGFTESGIIVGGTKIKLDPASSASYTMTLGLLTPNTSYSVKGYAVVPEGTAYSNEVSFKTNEALAKIKDVDGNEYDVVKIGTQTWTVQDWKAIHYRDGSAIENVTDNLKWKMGETGAYCYYANNPKFKSVLYNWYAIANPKGITPIGWHVPSEKEWATLENFLTPNSAVKLKEIKTATSSWFVSDIIATNSSGFTAVSTGCRGNEGDFLSGGSTADWWAYDLIYGGTRVDLLNDQQSLRIAGLIYKGYGNALRLIKD